jgi:putative ABC transport system permease protein
MRGPQVSRRGVWRGAGAVPLARRNLLADRRRLVAGVSGVGLAVMLILLLEGMWAGIGQQATVYTDRSGADVYVLQTGVGDLTAGVGTLPLGVLDRVRADPGVVWAAPVRTAYVILTLHGSKVAVYVVGAVPGQRGGAWSITEGRAPAADDEITAGALLARRHGIRVGDRLDLSGRSLLVVGLSRSAGFMFDYAFVTHTALGSLTGATATTSFVLAHTSDPSGVVARLRSAGLNALPRSQVAAANLSQATDIFGSPIRLMVGIGLAAGTLIIALTAYTAVIERRREYGIIKALGAPRGRLLRLALGHTFTLAGLGLVAGWLFFLGGREIIQAVRPQFSVLLTPATLGLAAAAVAAMALVAAVIPARQLATLEPAAAYRRAS